MSTSHFRFEVDHSPDTEAVLDAWSAAGPGRRPPLVERLVEFKHNKVYERSGIFRLAGVGPGRTAVVVKRGTSGALAVEALVYGEILPALSLPAPAYYGYLEDGAHSWLFMEEVIGQPFSQQSSVHKALAVEWLAALHVGTSKLDLSQRLPAEAPEHYMKCIASARESMRASLGALASAGEQSVSSLLRTLDDIEAAWSAACQRCSVIPQCLVHADFVNKNVVIVSRGTTEQLIALDWGIAGWGVPAPDLEYLEPLEYFALVRKAWPGVGLADVAYLRTVGVIMRHLGLLEIWTASLREEPTWALERLEQSAMILAKAAADLLAARA